MALLLPESEPSRDCQLNEIDCHRGVARAEAGSRRPHLGFLQYLLGFRKLGWDVLFLDRLEPDMCVDEGGRRVPTGDSWNVRYLNEVMCRFGLDRNFALLFDGGSRTIGHESPEVLERVRSSRR